MQFFLFFLFFLFEIENLVTTCVVTESELLRNTLCTVFRICELQDNKYLFLVLFLPFDGSEEQFCLMTSANSAVFTMFMTCMSIQRNNKCKQWFSYKQKLVLQRSKQSYVLNNRTCALF